MMDDSRVNGLEQMVFIGEIVKQTKIANRAAERLQATTDHFDGLEVWCSIQSILVAAGNVSKILCASRASSAARGENLRMLLNVDDHNLLSYRKFRNHFEHYDERIEDWCKKNQSALYMDSSIDSFESGWGSKLANRHRVYNPSTQTLTFR